MTVGQDRIWEYYQNDRASSFDASSARLTFLVKALLKRVPKGARVLNIGVGGGQFEGAALQHGLDVFSLDPSDRSITSLRERLGLEQQAKVGYAEDIPFESDFFEAVVMSEVLEHLTDSVLERTMTEVRRVLKPSGVLIGTVPAGDDLAANRVLCPCCGETFHRWGHEQSFSESSMRELLSRQLRVMTCERRYFVSWPHLNWKGRVGALAKLALLGAGVHGADENLYFVAEKE